ncbi:hypothetical protein EXIGLDRAFT_624024 [Exidia glandulosa HHB12029]|uniref:Uncharacterized protein n=1 Tax=Exidia glandulosa HHB12029 TaxID=1314781 RepID=A0A165DI73_EXIGL|nr:hypothetical protein EXIGLDRAFT_624024 [Exidia glandulosa HHB12029]
MSATLPQPPARITRDPTNDSPPDFSDPVHSLTVEAVMAKLGDTRDAAVAHLLAAYNTVHDREVAAWDAQLLADETQARADEAARVQAEADARRLEQEAAEAERAAEEKTKKKLPDIADDTAIGDYSEAQPSSYAREKLRKREFIQLDWFTPKRCAEALLNSTDQEKSLSFVDGQVILASTATKALKEPIRMDTQLSWEEIGLARTIFLRTMRQVGWPSSHITAHADLFMGLDAHPIRGLPFGNEVVARYLADARVDYHRRISDSLGGPIYNIGIINEARLNRIDGELRREREERQVAALVRTLSCPFS